MHADPNRIAQVLTNIMDNAVKYSPDGGEIAITLDRDGSGCAVRTVDHGIGISAEGMERIFEPFERARNAEETFIPGLGLGLHICRSIIEQHAGRIWMESAGIGQGTTVAFWLPILKLVDTRSYR